MVVDPAGDDRYYAAARADMELRGAGAKCVSGYVRGVVDCYLQSPLWIGRPHATVLGAKRAGAGAGRDFGGIRLPGEGEGDVPAVALTVDQHTDVIDTERDLLTYVPNTERLRGISTPSHDACVV